MPSLDGVSTAGEFLSFLGNLFLYLIDTIKDMFNFITNVFNVSYFTEIFSYLPNPFGTILIALTTFIFIIIIAKLIKVVIDIIPV